MPDERGGGRGVVAPGPEPERGSALQLLNKFLYYLLNINKNYKIAKLGNKAY